MMILTCPQCSTRYLVDARALGGAGRTVRCAHCAHTWHATPVEDAPAPLDLAAPPAPEPVAAERKPLGAGRAQLPALPPEPRRSILLPLLVALLLVAIVGAGTWFTKDRVAAQWPALARYYQMVGIPVDTGETSFDIKVGKPTRDAENGIVIQGDVVNISSYERQVPRLRATLLDSSKHPLQSWSFTVSDDRLKPGASIPFRTSIAQPNLDATDVEISVVDGG
jgi:predicted Zn finger-like uncharacterized protein